jgi:MYXO-CTERM domain-containing protein
MNLVRGRSWCAAAIVLALTCATGIAWSHSNGESGHSGKQGLTCNDCHSGGPTPNVFFDGPTTIEAGTTVTYTFHVKTTQPLAGMNVAATDGIQLHDDDAGTTYLSASEELVHPRPLATGAGDAGDAGDAGEAVFTFSLDAPQYAGTIQLWGAGNAVNGNKDTTGDKANDTKITIIIDGPPAPQPEAGPPPPPPPPPPTQVPTLPPVPNPDAGATSPSKDDDGGSGCAVGATASDASTGAAAFVLLALARAVSRRRRRTSRPS